MNHPSQPTRPYGSRAQRGTRLFATVLVCLLLAGFAVMARASSPFIWDDDSDGLDDRMESVHLLGYSYSFAGGDSLGRQRFQVTRAATDLVYGVYVVFEAPPGATDIAALSAIGMPVLHRFEAVPVVRSLATFAQAQAAKALPSVERLEVVTLLYPESREDLASAGVVDETQEVFPTWQGTGGATGDGIIVALLDTGVNDSADGPYPGHESLAGRRVGGASFTTGDSALDTPMDGSEDPEDRGGALTHAHGTHVAGIVLGSGGSSGYAPGVAPQARFVDVKVLGDTGYGLGVAEALDWCIHNRSRDWGAGAAWKGIDVINLSLSSVDESDGNDVQSQLAARAVAVGICVVASAGNASLANHIPSPAAGDGVLTIGAYDAQRTPRASDDQFASFSDQGPRASDGDASALDELKPDLVAPGVAVLSADGDLNSDGTRYQRLNGTSMSAALVSGAVAALRSEFSGLTPGDIAQVLRVTARRDVGGLPAGTPGADPRWHSAMGWGALDLYAARLELLQSQRSQVRRLALVKDAASVTVTAWTQRERGAAYFVLERASDLGGTPSTFAAIDSAAATGDSSLASTNLTGYSWVVATLPAERGLTYWYRVAYTEAGARFATPSRAFTNSAGTSVATLRVRIVHDAYDHDIDATVTVGGQAGMLRSGTNASALSPPTYFLPGSSASVSSDYVNGTSITGTVAWDFEIEVPAGEADAYLPPTTTHPWLLQATEGGYLNRSGRIERFEMTWHGPNGDMVFMGAPVPQATIEGQTAQVSIAPGVLGVEAPPVPSLAFRAIPSPVVAGGNVRLVAGGRDPGPLRVFDLGGREVARSPFMPSGGQWTASWNTAQGTGGAARAGVYFARAGGATARIVVLGR